MVLMKKSTPFRHTRYRSCYKDCYMVVIFVIQNFLDAMDNVFNEMVLKFFINTFAKPHAKRLSWGYKTNCGKKKVLLQKYQIKEGTIFAHS